MTKQENVNLVDCTLRDGGYYTNWEFSDELVANYLESMSLIGIDFVEIGFRSFPPDEYRGPYYFSGKKIVDRLDIPSNLSIGIMINASELIHEKETCLGLLSKLMEDVSSKVKLVRLACHLKEVAPIIPCISWLKERGYIVGVNLMQIASKAESEISNLIKMLDESSCDVVYFADSFGSLLPQDIDNIIKLFKKHTTKDIGIHTHDNMGNAVANTLQAVDLGAKWVDSTVTGMGRGPGNAQTEYLSIELRADTDEYANLMRVIEKHFLPLQKKHGWGKNPFYYLAGKHDIHPTFIQSIIDDEYSAVDALEIIKELSVISASKFDPEVLSKLDKGDNDKWKSGSWSPALSLGTDDVIVIGPGPSMYTYKDHVNEFIKERKPTVIALNAHEHVHNKFVDYRVACHPLRLRSDLHKYKVLGQPLILPMARLGEITDSPDLQSVKMYDYGMSISSGEFEIHDEWAAVPSDLVFAYLLAIVTCAKAKTVYLAGLDGYDSDLRNQPIEDILREYLRLSNRPVLKTLTPTKYKLKSEPLFFA